MRRAVGGVDWMHRLEELAYRYLKGSGQADEHVGPGIGLSELHLAHILVAQARQLRERFLRQVAILAETTELRAQ